MRSVTPGPHTESRFRGGRMDKRDTQSNDIDTSQVTRVWQLPPSRSRPADAKSIRASRCCGPGFAARRRALATNDFSSYASPPACSRCCRGTRRCPLAAVERAAAAMLRSLSSSCERRTGRAAWSGSPGTNSGDFQKASCGGAGRSLDTLPGDSGREAFAWHHDFTRLRGEVLTGTASPSISTCFRPSDWPQLWFGSYARLCGRSQTWPSLRLKRWTVVSPSGMAITMSPF